jgi:hypothetical protein
MKVGTLLEVEVEDESGIAWRAAKVVEIVDRAAGRFRACICGDTEFIEAYGPEDEGSDWRTPAEERLPELQHEYDNGVAAFEAALAARAAARAAVVAASTASSAAGSLDDAIMDAGTIIEVEVAAADDSVSWKPARVTALLPAGRFATCVNGEGDFVEEYGPDEEGSEWRRVPVADAIRVAAAYEVAAAAWESGGSATGYVAESILRQRRRPKALGGGVEYLVKWRGWPESSATWEPQENLATSPALLRDYETRVTGRSAGKAAAAAAAAGKVAQEVEGEVVGDERVDRDADEVLIDGAGRRLRHRSAAKRRKVASMVQAEAEAEGSASSDEFEGAALTEEGSSEGDEDAESEVATEEEEEEEDWGVKGGRKRKINAAEAKLWRKRAESVPVLAEAPAPSHRRPAASATAAGLAPPSFLLFMPTFGPEAGSHGEAGAVPPFSPPPLPPLASLRISTSLTPPAGSKSAAKKPAAATQASSSSSSSVVLHDHHVHSLPAHRVQDIPCGDGYGTAHVANAGAPVWATAWLTEGGGAHLAVGTHVDGASHTLRSGANAIQFWTPAGDSAGGGGATIRMWLELMHTGGGVPNGQCCVCQASCFHHHPSTR